MLSFRTFTTGEIFALLSTQSALRLLGGVNIVAADVVEVAPPFDLAGVTALAGATMLFELLCVVASNLSAVNGPVNVSQRAPQDVATSVVV